ncbi:hypothetical protein H7J88_20200 [Mycolicibacterium flavescens]|uniref:Uncharacterized protein n=1 Tax=Mycolicibacterium flavescens TaxID=1776 RepID=A0A1E3RLF4_MYCFV|nr:hypothetical protein [Mycolicibacterium flavescens]MCV7281954.1 hypothetical protein [Mycolicibacterium flavescens]ODQ90678.1 hypothetical protein BHQ18_08010 [Mycolicibacterium flavescens]
MKRIADVVPTLDLVEPMIRDKPVCWSWAAFASVVFHRWAALEERKIRQVLGSPVMPEGVLLSDPDVAWFVSERLCDAENALAKFVSLLADPAFAGVFGAPNNEDGADGPAIVAAAHVFGDCYQQMLSNAEECRIWLPPKDSADLMADTIRLLNGLVRDMAGFVNDVLLRLENLQRLALQDRLPAAFEPVYLELTVDERLATSIDERLQQLG